MPVPKRKHSKSRRDKRRTHNERLSPPTLSKCSHCGQPTLSHRVCPHCGYYGGRLIVEMEKEKG